MISKTKLFNLSAGLLLAASAAFAQGGKTFEVAAVKPSALDYTKLAQQMQTTGQMPKMGAHVDGLRAEYLFMGVRDLIAEAYKLKPFEITGPDWMTNFQSQRFDILAKMPEGSKKEDAREMLQALLADRFKLVVHKDNKERNVLALVVSKGGIKMKELPEDKDIDPDAPLKEGEQQMDTPEGPVRMTVNTKDGSSSVNMGKRGKWNSKMDPATGTLHMEGTQTTMSAFADMLTQMTAMTGGGARVVDMTNLKGHYAVALDFSMADLMKIAQSVGVDTGGRGGTAGEASDPSGSTTIYNAVNALGLKLEGRKAPVEQLMVDKVEKMPTEN